MALNYIHPNDNTFEIQLDGYDREWQTLDRGSISVRYSNIGPGKYTLRVRLAGVTPAEYLKQE